MTESPDHESDLAATDPAALDRLARFGGAKLLREMIRLFLEAAPARIDAARAAVKDRDVSGAEQALHSLKSSAAQLGAMRMQRLSQAGEERARAGSLTGVPELVQELDDELTRVREWLTRARESEIT
jgi:HPt (histidine-containing phosphotransfer) domain-containing protein